MGRVLPYVEYNVETDFSTAKIPVKELNPADKTDSALRKYASDWLRLNIKNIRVQTAFEKVERLSWYTDPVGETPGEEIPFMALLVLQWWPKPELTEHELLLARQKANREAARKGE